MAHMTPFAESDFDSIHSSQAFVGDHQVMYTPPLRPKKASRFASTQSYVLPDIPNTSHIVGEPMGKLPKFVPAKKENDIVNALTRLQKQLEEAKVTIKHLIRERDEYRDECKALRKVVLQVQQQQNSPRRSRKGRIPQPGDNDLFDLTHNSDAEDEFTQRLPPITLPHPKGGLQPAVERQHISQDKRDMRVAPGPVPPTRFTQAQQIALPKQQRQPQAQRQPMRELSEGQVQQHQQQKSQRASKKVVIEDIYVDEVVENPTATQQSHRNITYLRDIPDNQAFASLRSQLEAERLSRQRQKSQSQKYQDIDVKVIPPTQDALRPTRAATAPPPEQSKQAFVEDATATSNISRRLRRRASDLQANGGAAADDLDTDDENMTSAYILPDITMAKPAQPVHREAHAAAAAANNDLEDAAQQNKRLQIQLSREAKDLLHTVDPGHVVSCEHCRRLLRLPEKLQVHAKEGHELGGHGRPWEWCMVLGEK
jgi:hypothetical protein